MSAYIYRKYSNDNLLLITVLIKMFPDYKLSKIFRRNFLVVITSD